MEQKGSRLWQILTTFFQSIPRLWGTLARSKWFERVGFYVVVPLLLLLSLWLPPVSLRTRVFHLDYPLVTPEKGGIVPGPAGAKLEVPAQAVQKRLRLAMTALVPADLAKAKPGSPEALAGKSFPDGAQVRGPLYRLDMLGPSPTKGTLTLPVPADLAATEVADLYGWDGSAWRWLPSHPDSSVAALRAELEQVPALLMIAQSQPPTLRVAMNASADTLDKADSTYVSLGGLTLDADGGIAGQPPDAATLKGAGNAQVLLSISNQVGGVIRSDLLDNLMADAKLRQTHAQKIVDLAKSGTYGGIEIAYQGLDPNLRAEYAAFVAELAQGLHAAGKVLAVSVDMPVAAGASWDTGGYDWKSLGRSADFLRVPVLTDLAAYAAGGPMDQLMAWATGEVNRRKIDLALSAYAQDRSAGKTVPLSYKAALSLLAQDMSADSAERILLPGQSLTVTLPKVGQDAMRLDNDSQVYWFTYQNQSEHTVTMANASSVARKLQWVGRYALGGVAIDGALDEGSDAGIAEVVRTFQDNTAPLQPRFALVWTVADEAGKVVETRVAPLTNPKWQWTAPNNPGNYVIGAAVSDNGGESVVAAVSTLDVQVPTPTFTPTPTPTNTPTPTATPTNTPTETPVPTDTPVPTEAAAAPQESQPTGGEAQPTSQPQQPQAPPPAPVPAGGANAGFGYGIQADLMSDGNHQRIFGAINGIGFNWVKQQIEWFRYNPQPGAYDWGPIDNLVNNANAAGVNVLLSVVKAPKWARPPGDTDQGPPADPNTYGTFLAAMAERYRGRVRAYEIWNEQNLYYEWGGRGGKLNAGRYVQLLAVAYNAIKSKDPSAVVISGALTPTGWNDGDTAIDDRVYLEQMYQAGLARYCDAVGAHPSGYNNPPDADWTSFSDPTTGRAKGHPSWFFRGTMESYRNIMLKYGDGGKKIWPTEFGWASVEGLGTGPAAGYEYAADNTEGEQAQFIVRAYQIARSWGWVGPMFLWNLNFGPVSGARDEKAAFGIVRPDWGQRAAYGALRDMPK